MIGRPPRPPASQLTARLLDGAALSRRLQSGLAGRIAALRDARRPPGLAVVLVGDDPASAIYVGNKVKACAGVGIVSTIARFPSSVREGGLLESIRRLGDDPAIDGILVQAPLPRSIDPDRVIDAIPLAKDVDGFKPMSAGALVTGQVRRGVGFHPCTPSGIVALLEDAGIPISGARAVVVGRSVTVGKPAALMLLERNATVTICHSATRDLAAVVKEGDIVVAAAGRPRLVTADMIRPGAAVVDVGIHRGADGRLTGDVDFAAVREVAGWISPVPGGVGPMTIAMLLTNTVIAAERIAGLRSSEQED